jgi:4-hydroxybenzoate polyprenyltransferase
MVSSMTPLERIREFLILIRIQQVGTSITPIIGALSVKGAGLELSTAALLFLVAAIINIGGQVHNDLCDYEIDKQSEELKRRPLVREPFLYCRQKSLY